MHMNGLSGVRDSHTCEIAKNTRKDWSYWAAFGVQIIDK